MIRASLVVQWLRICLPTQGTRVRALVREDPTCHGATKPVHHNYEVGATPRRTLFTMFATGNFCFLLKSGHREPLKNFKQGGNIMFNFREMNLASV